jgi:Anthrone oxygenase
MLPLIQFIAVLATTLFAGAAIYINLVEHPARMSCATEIAAAVWAPSYRRATAMQASLAIAGSLAGLAAWMLGAGLTWLVAALFILAVVPVTFIIIFPTNKQLLAPGRDPSSAETRRLLITWGQLHAIRSALSLIASAIFVWQLVDV